MLVFRNNDLVLSVAENLRRLPEQLHTYFSYLVQGLGCKYMVVLPKTSFAEDERQSSSRTMFSTAGVETEQTVKAKKKSFKSKFT